MKLRHRVRLRYAPVLESLGRHGLGGLRARQGRPFALVLSVLLGLALVGIRPAGDGPLPGIRLSLFDAYQVWMPRQRHSGPVQIVAIDEAALKQYGQWPWPRTRLAELIGRIGAGQPLAIGLDMMMPEADTGSPEALAQRLAPGPLRDGLAALPANDAVLADALRRVPVVLGAAGLNDPGAGTAAAALRIWPMTIVRRPGSAAARKQAGSALAVWRFPQALASLPLLQAAAQGQGLLSAALEKGVVRRVPLVAAVGDTLVPSLAMELLRVATGVPALEIAADNGSDTGAEMAAIDAISVGDLRVPTAPDGTVWVNFSAPAPERYVSALDVMRARIAPDALENKIVIVALTGLGLSDYKTNVRGDFLPGVDVHAQLIESFFDGAMLRRPASMRWIELLAFAGASLLLIWAMPRMRLRMAALLAGALALALPGAGALLFSRAGWLFDAATVLCALAAVVLSLLTSMLSAAVRDRKLSERALFDAQVAAAKNAGELDAARRIQMASLPSASLAFAGERRFALDALLEPARQVGGDLYDFFMLDADRLFFMIGDVSGKGLPASLFMVVAKALSKSVALRMGAGAEAGTGPGADMAAIMNQANLELVRENPEMLFVTSVAGILDASTGEVVLCNAGHDAPRRLRAGAGVERLQPAGGPPLCVIDDFDYPVQRYQLQPGDYLCLTTDGINEAMNLAGDLYGNERLDALLATVLEQGAAVALPLPPPSTVLAAVRDDVRAHVGQAEASDDLTLLVFQWLAPAG